MSSAPRFDTFDDYDNYEPVAQRPRANVPPGPIPNFIPPQYTRLAGPVRASQPAPRQSSMPQPVVRPGIPRDNARALRAPTMRPRRQPFLSGLVSGYGIMKWGLMIAGGIVTLLLVYFLVSNVVHWWQTWQDDMTYGRPRTVQVDQFVGHNEEDGTPSHFIVQNNNRQVTVVEYPGGDVTKTRVIPGPRLFGKEMELAPVKVRFQDVNLDNHVDMVLSVDNQEIIYINENGNFRPITNEERGKFVKLSGGSK